MNCLRSVLKQYRVPDEIIVVDASSAVLPQDSLRFMEENDVLYIKSSKGLTLQRNIGVQIASGDLFSFIDDDVELEADYFRKVIDAFINHPDLGGCTGCISNITHYGKLSQLFRRIFLLDTSTGSGRLLLSGHPDFNHDMSQTESVEILSGCNMTYKKNVFHSNMFDENLTDYSLGEDVDFSFRVSRKYPLLQLADARLTHHMSQNARSSSVKGLSMLLSNSKYLSNKYFGMGLAPFTGWLWSAFGIGAIQLISSVRKRDMFEFRAFIQAFILISRSRL